MPIARRKLAAGIVLSCLLAAGCGGSRRPVSPPLSPPAAPVLGAGEAQQLYESGRHQEVVARLPPLDAPGDPRVAYLAGLSFLRLERRDAAMSWFSRLDRGDEPDSWRLVGRLAQARLGGPPPALEAAMSEAARFGQDPFVQFEYGLAALDRNRPADAIEAFGRTIAAEPRFAYAHYFAGLAAERLKRTDQLVTHLETFLRLAPSAPERSAVEALLRRVRGVDGSHG